MYVFHNENENIIVPLSWKNVGFHLPLDGSKDLDINSLHKTKRIHTKVAKLQYRKEVEQYERLCTLQYREYSPNQIQRPDSYYKIIQDQAGNIAHARQNSNIPLLPRDIRETSLQTDVTEYNRIYIDRMNEILDKDLSTLIYSELTFFGQVLCPVDVHCLTALYRSHKPYRLENLLLNELALPIRDEHGQVINYSNISM